MSCFPSRFSDGIEPVPKVRRVIQESTSRRAKRPLDVLTEWAYAVYSCKTRNADSRSFRWWRVFSVAATSAPADPRRPFSARASKQSSVWEEEDGTSTAAVRPRVASDVAVVAARPSPGGGEDAQLGFGSASRASRDVHGAGSPAAQRVVIQKLAKMEEKRGFARRLAGCAGCASASCGAGGGGGGGVDGDEDDKKK